MFLRCPSCLLKDCDPPLWYDVPVDRFRCWHCFYTGTEEEVRSLHAVKRRFYPQLKVRNTFGLPK